MNYAQNWRGTPPPQGAIDELRQLGVSDDEIALAFNLQESQRANGVPVLPLRVLAGIEPVARRSGGVFSSAISGLLHKAPFKKVRTGGKHITGNPVWAGSVRTGGDEERQFLRPIDGDKLKELRRAGHRLFEKARECRRLRRLGEALSDHQLLIARFTRSCRDVYLKLIDNIHFRKGWCRPSYEKIMEWTSLGRSTVHMCLRILGDIGLIEWVRRFVYTVDKETGARSEQTSNLYRCNLPQWIGKLVNLVIPTPVDEEQRRDDALEAHADMLGQASTRERTRFLPDDPAARAALILAAERAAKRAQAEAGSRESRICIPPLLNLFSKGESELP